MHKYSLLYERVAQSQLAAAGTICVPPAASVEKIVDIYFETVRRASAILM